MAWHLKDRELEKVFEAYSGGEFVKALNYAIEQENIDSECIVYVEFGREFLGPDFAENCLCFRTDELEEVAEYNQHAWNNYPEVTPPEGVLMRVEIDSNGILLRNCAIFSGADWRITSDGSAVYADGYTLDNVKRFRPWED